jgi:uncharacterized repeat protein (TIGR01451 family)
VTVPTPVAASANLQLTKVASSASGTAGGTISYTVTLVNLGPSTAQNVTITDVLSAGLSRIGASSNNGAVVLVDASTSRITTSSLALGQTLTMVVNATVTASTGVVTNTAAGTSTTPDPTPPGTVTVPTPVAASANLQLTKVASSASGTAGGTISYTVTLVNLGPSTAQNVTITDVLSAGLSRIGASSNNGAVVLVDASTSRITTSSLALGQTLTMVVNATVTASTGVVTNTAAGTSTTPDPTPPGTVTVPTPVAASANLQLTKVASSASGTAGGTISYTVTLVNLGPSTAQNVTLTDVLSAGLSRIGASSNNGAVALVDATTSRITTSSLALGQTLTLVVNATVTASTGVVTNTAAGTSTTPDPTPPGTVTVPTPVAASANLQLTKVASSASGTAGGTISYTVTLVNLGPSTAQNVTITDVLSAGLSRIGASSNNGAVVLVDASTSRITTSSLALGQTLTMVVNATVTASTGVVTNTAAGTSTTPDPTPPGTVTVPTPVAASANLQLTKVASSASGTAGGTISYTVTLVNLGPSTAQNVTITDVLSAGLSRIGASSNNGAVVLVDASTSRITTSSLALGQTLTMVVNATVTASTGVVTNTAAGTSTTPDPTPPGTVTVPTPVAASANLQLTKVASSASGTAGGTISYTVTLVNLGPSTAQNVTITDVLSAGLSRIGASSNNGAVVLVDASTSRITTSSLALGQTLTMVVNATVTASTGVVTNTAAGTSTTPDPTPPGTVTVPTPVAASANLQLTKVASSASGTAGGTISYTVTLVNLGPSTAQNVTITDVLSAGLSRIGASSNNGAVVLVDASTSRITTSSLALGQTLTMVVNATVTASTGVVTNTAAGTSTTPDPTPPGTVTVPTPVAASANLQLTKVASSASGTAGGTISYTVTLVNLGPSTAQNVTITDVLSAGLSRIGASSNNGAVVLVDASTSRITTSSLALGQTLTMVVNATVTASTGVVTNTAAGTSTTPDPTPPGTVTVPTPVAASANLQLTKVASSASGTAGGTISYTVTLVNLGPSTAQNVTITDVLSAGLSRIGASSNNGAVVLVDASTSRITTSSLALGQTLTMVVNATVTASTGVVTNTAAGTSTTPDPTPPGTVTVPTPVAASANLQLTKVASSASGTAGGTISYTVTLVNLGPSTAQNVTITDVLSAGLSRIGASSNNGAVVLVDASTSRITTSSLALGQTLTMVVNATVTASTGVVTNTAAGTSTTPDPTPPGTVTVPTPVAASANLQLTKVASSASGTAGGTISYTVTLVNLGPSTAQNVTITDVLSAGLSRIGASSNNGAVVLVDASTSRITTSSLALGQTLTMVVNATVTASTGVVTNTAAGTSTTPDPTPPGTVTVPTPVAASANLQLTKVASSASGTAGGTISYTVTLVNLGPSTAQNVTLTDVLSAGLSRIGASSNNGAVALVDATTSRITTSSLALGQTLTLVVNATVTASTGVVTNTAAGTSTTPDPTPPGTVTVPTPVAAVADVSTSLSVTANGTPGSTITATATFTNNGPSTADDVTATIVLPGGAIQTRPIGSLSAGASTVTVVTYSVPANATGTLGWTAGLATTTPESSTVNNTVTAVTGMNALTDVGVSLTVPTAVTPGTTVNATVTFTNNGPGVAQFVTATFTPVNGSSTVVFTATAMPVGSTTVVVVPYRVPGDQSVGMIWTATIATTTPETQLSNNVAVATLGVTTVTNATVSGFVWYDINRNRTFDSPPVDQPLAGFRVELLKGSTVVGTATTAVNGSYQIGGQVPGAGYSLRFLDPTGKQVYGTPFNQSSQTLLANPSTGTGSLTSPVSPGQLIPPAGVISNVTLYAGDNVVQQNLPVDPNGVVYDSVTRQPLVGAAVTLSGPAGFDPAVHLIGGSNVSTTQVGGFYQFLLTASAPSGVYSLQVAPPTGYASGPATLGGVAQPGTLNPVPAGVVNVQPQSTAPAVGVNGAATQYFLSFGFVFPTSGQVFNNHIPLDPLAVGAILVNKIGNKTIAEIGDSVQYTIRLRNTSSNPIANVVLEDLLPVGFRYIPGSARLSTGSGTSTVTDPAGSDGRQLNFLIGSIQPASAPELTYFVRVGAGSQTGDGINRATAVFPGPGTATVRSNTAVFKVNVQGGVFTNQGCIIGKVYVDCDGNAVQNNTSGSRDLGIPGVRLVLLDGTYVITDVEGKYSLCGIKSQTQVIKVDRSTLPAGSRLVPSSNRNAGVGDSLFVDMRGGEMARADFIEGSCSPEVMDQVKARRGQGIVIVPAPITVLPGAQGVQR